MPDRRTYLSAVGVGLVGSLVASRPVSATSTTLSGTIESAVGADIDGSRIELFSPDINDFTRATITDGYFETEVESDVTYYLTFYHQDESGSYRTGVDDIPLLYGLDDNVQPSGETTDAGSYELPEGHLAQIRFEDLDGNPVRHLDVGFRATTGGGTGPGRFSTNAEGYVYVEDETDPGVNLSGEVGVELQEPGGSGGGTNVDRVRVTENREFTVPIRDPEAYGGVVMTSDGSDSSTDGSGSSANGDGAGATSPGSGDDTASGSESAPGASGGSSGDHRGFLTNDADSSFAFLDDPVTLTWAGIGVSIVGIITQLFGRQS